MRKPTLFACLAASLTLVVLLALAPGEAPTAASDSAANSADRLIFWTGCREVAELSDEELDVWKERGVDGFVCMVGHLRGMGGSQDFTADPDASLILPKYALQRELRDSDIADRAAARGMKLYMGFKLVNYFNHSTPLVDWFDNDGWNDDVLPKVRDFAGAARVLGFAGVAVDQELYPQQGRISTATWRWSYPGNTHSEAEVRAKARTRGKQMMSALAGAFPGLEIAAYDVRFPETWIELVQREVNGNDGAYDKRLDVNFWDGMTAIVGYSAIRLFDSTFYKMPHRGTWAGALQYHQNRIYAYLSRNFANWEYASSRLHVTPFSWIDAGPCDCDFDAARSPEYVAEQLTAFRQWGAGGEFANFAYSRLEDFDYSPYEEAMQNASTPAVVDESAPRLAVTPASSSSPVLRGIAIDNLALRRIAWTDDAGGSGVAVLRWQIFSGDYDKGYVDGTIWRVPLSELSPAATRVELVAEDIKDNSSRTVTVDLGKGVAGPPQPLRRQARALK